MAKAQDWPKVIEQFHAVEHTSLDKLYMCEWEYLDEGYDGDFDPDDPEDEPLLRFTIYKWVQHGPDAGEWAAIDDASYCTQNPLTTSEADLRSMSDELIYEARRAIEAGASCRKAMERASWITP